MYWRLLHGVALVSWGNKINQSYTCSQWILGSFLPTVTCHHTATRMRSLFTSNSKEFRVEIRKGVLWTLGKAGRTGKPSDVVVVQFCSCFPLFATPWNAAHQASVSFTIHLQSLLRLMSDDSVMPSSHPLLLLPSLFLTIRAFTSLRVGSLR